MIRRLFVGALLAGVTAIGVAPAAFADRPYANCTEAHADGAYDIPESDPAYWPAGDRDQDGYACES